MVFVKAKVEIMDVDCNGLSSERKGCIAAAAAILGAKWTPQILYGLFNDVHRFCELQKEVGGVNPRTLSARLVELEKAGIVQKDSFAEIPPRIEYSLTPRGRDLVPILELMVEWSEKHPPTADEVAACESELTAQKAVA
ncbi:MAG: winged helix-turn-helix transcriptional regulator [Candidatus Saccharibacteria bacterium]